MAGGRLSVFDFLNLENSEMDSSVDSLFDNSSVEQSFGSTQTIFDALTSAEENAARAALQADIERARQESFYLFGEPESEFFPELFNAGQSAAIEPELWPLDLLAFEQASSANACSAMLDVDLSQADRDRAAENFLNLRFTTLPTLPTPPAIKSKEDIRLDLDDGRYRTRFNRSNRDELMPAEYRREALMSYRLKKEVGKISSVHRNKEVLYPSRKKFADSRPRVQGRFVTIKHEEAEPPQLRSTI
jgi:hypothetical protein